jgi:alkylmercury lyase
MSAGPVQLSAIADSLAGALPGCQDAPLALTLVRELAHGHPVSTAALAALAGRDEAEIEAALTAWPTVERDDERRVTAFSGLTLRPTEHRLEIDGRALHAWCAWDTLFLPAMLGRPARVRSRCPVTGADVHLTVGPEGVQASDPAPLAVSFPPPDAACAQDITGSFCCHVHFLAGAQAAARWRGDHDGAVVLDLDQAFELGRMATRACLDAG